MWQKGKCVLSNNLDAIFSRTFAISIVKDAFPGQFLSEGRSVDVSILSYSIESVIAEKMHAVIDLADQNSRMKDYYDLYRILKDGKFDSSVLQEAIIKTFQNRHTAYDADAMFFRDDFARSGNMEMRWAAFMRKITKTEEEPFADVAAFIRNALRPYWENFGSRG